jgi:hypothetical protein
MPMRVRRACQSAHDGIHHISELPTGIGKGVKVMLAGAPGLDQSAVTKQGKVVAYRRLALRPQIGAELGDVALFFAQEHEHLQASWIGNLLQQLGNATNFGCRSRGDRCGFCGPGRTVWS